MSKAKDLKIRKLDGPKLTVNIVVTREFKARLVAAKCLFRMGSWILGCRGEIESTQS